MIKNSTQKKTASVLAAFARKCGEVSANTKCVCIYHQPKAPDSLKKLRKF